MCSDKGRRVNRISVQNCASSFFCEACNASHLVPSDIRIPHSWPADTTMVQSSWNVKAHGDAREGKWRGNWRMQWVASTLHTTSEHGVPSITTADAHTSAASSRLNWPPPGRFKWTCPFRWKTKSGFCACAITFQLASTSKRNSTTYNYIITSYSNIDFKPFTQKSTFYMCELF